MRVEDCIVSVERRSVAGCLDLAFVFAREFAVPLMQLTALFAVPSCLLVWFSASWRTDMLIPSLLVFMFSATLFNGAITAAVGPQVFGVPMKVGSSLATFRISLRSYVPLSVLCRLVQFLSAFCLLFPALLLTAHFGHLSEVIILERTPVGQIFQRLAWLSRGGGFGRNLCSAVFLLGCWLTMSAGLLVIGSVLSSVLFRCPVIPEGVFTAAADSEVRLISLVLDSPLFLTSLQAVLWLPFPVIRMAWFFCYLDQRIRRECWDLELHSLAEAKRLEAMR